MSASPDVSPEFPPKVPWKSPEGRCRRSRDPHQGLRGLRGLERHQGSPGDIERRSTLRRLNRSRSKRYAPASIPAAGPPAIRAGVPVGTSSDRRPTGVRRIWTIVVSASRVPIRDETTGPTGGHRDLPCRVRAGSEAVATLRNRHVEARGHRDQARGSHPNRSVATVRRQLEITSGDATPYDSVKDRENSLGGVDSGGTIVWRGLEGRTDSRESALRSLRGGLTAIRPTRLGFLDRLVNRVSSRVDDPQTPTTPTSVQDFASGSSQVPSPLNSVPRPARGRVSPPSRALFPPSAPGLAPGVFHSHPRPNVLTDRPRWTPRPSSGRCW